MIKSTDCTPPGENGDPLRVAPSGKPGPVACIPLKSAVRPYALAQQIKKPQGYWSSACAGSHGLDFCRRVRELRV